MAITNRTATVVENNGVTSVTGTLPTGTTTGDYVVAAFALPGTVAQFTAPSGWTQIVAPVNIASSTEVFAVYGRLSPPGNPTASTSGSAGRVSAITQAFVGVDQTTPVDVSAHSTNFAGLGQTSWTETGVTTVTDGAMAITAAMADRSSVTPVMSTGGWTLDGATGGVTGRCLGTALKTITTAAATGSVSWTTSGAPTAVDAATAMFALRPAVAAGAPPTAPRRPGVRSRPGAPATSGRRAVTAPAQQAAPPPVVARRQRIVPARRRPVVASPVPAQVIVPPAWVPQRRAPLRVLAVLRRRRGDPDVPPAGQELPWVQSRRRMPLLRRRPAAVAPIPAQVFAGPPYPVRPSNPRRMGRRLARPSAVTPIPAQIVPPPAWVPVRPMLRRVAAVLRRQRGDTAPPVDQAPVPIAARARVRPSLRRRPWVAWPVPPQAPPPWVPQARSPRRVVALVRRQRGDVVPPLEQGGPPSTAVRRWRAPWRRRPSTVTPIPAQQFTGPAYPPAPTDPRRRGMLPRRGRAATPVPAQQFAGPAFVPVKASPRRVLAAVRRRVLASPPVVQAAAVAGPVRRLRFGWRRRPADVTPVPVQEAPPRPVPGRRSAAAAAASRPRRSVSPPVPQTAPPAVRPARVRLATLRARRGRTAQPARPQDVIPPYPVRPSSPRRVLAAVRGLRRLTPKWIGVGLPAGVRPGRMTDGTRQGPAMDTGTTRGAQMTAGYRTNPDADTADDVTEGG